MSIVDSLQKMLEIGISIDQLRSPEDRYTDEARRGDGPPSPLCRRDLFSFRDICDSGQMVVILAGMKRIGNLGAISQRPDTGLPLNTHVLVYLDPSSARLGHIAVG